MGGGAQLLPAQRLHPAGGGACFCCCVLLYSCGSSEQLPDCSLQAAARALCACAWLGKHACCLPLVSACRRNSCIVGQHRFVLELNAPGVCRWTRAWRTSWCGCVFSLLLLQTSPIILTPNVYCRWTRAWRTSWCWATPRPLALCTGTRSCVPRPRVSFVSVCSTTDTPVWEPAGPPSVLGQDAAAHALG